MKSRLATFATIATLLGGTGGAVALASHGPGGGPNHSAASGQYRPGKGCGDKNHKHTGPPGNPSNTSCPPQSQHAKGNQSQHGKRHHHGHKHHHGHPHHSSQKH